MEAIDLTPTVLQSLDIAKVFKSSSDISSLSFSPDGQFLLSSSSDISFYNVLKGSHEKSILSNTSLVHFTNHPNGFLSVTPNSIDYWCLPGTRIIHSYLNPGVVSIDMSPRNDLFLSTTNKQLSVFDLNTRQCLAILDLHESVGNILCKYDCYGLIFVVVYPVITQGRYRNIIQVFDAKEFSKGAFAMWNFEGAEAVSVDFSYDGQFIIVNTKNNQIFLIDSLEGSIKNVFKEYLGNGVCPAVFSPDSKYFFIGCDKNFTVEAINVDTFQKVHEIKGCGRTIKSIAWSPDHCVMATGTDHLVLWVPNYLNLR